MAAWLHFFRVLIFSLTKPCEARGFLFWEQDILKVLTPLLEVIPTEY